MVVVLPFDKVFLRLLQPYLSVMLNKGSLEVLVFTGHHNPRRIIRRPEQGALNDGREHSLRIERLPGRLVFCMLVCGDILGCGWLIKISVCVFDFVVCFRSDLLRFRWTRRPRRSRRFPTTSRWACSTSSLVGSLQKWSRRPTELTSHSRDAYGTWWSIMCE